MELSREINDLKPPYFNVKCDLQSQDLRMNCKLHCCVSCCVIKKKKDEDVSDLQIEPKERVAPFTARKREREGESRRGRAVPLPFLLFTESSETCLPSSSFLHDTIV